MSRDELVAHIPRLRRYGRALTGDAGRADDLVQDTLEKALARLRFPFAPRGDLRPWLFSIMHNLFISQVRRPDRVEYQAEPDATHAAPGTPLDGLALRDLDAALQRLPEEQREVLLLVGLEELSYADAAKVLGIPAGTVMSRLSRGRERLRALLAGTEDARPLKVVK